MIGRCTDFEDFVLFVREVKPRTSSKARRSRQRARDPTDGAANSPLISSAGVPDTFGSQEDYLAGLSWRLGPGGWCDFSRIHSSEARLNVAKLDL
jgi:hypothetical protein